MKNSIVLLVLSVLVAVLFFVFHRLAVPTLWLSLGLGIGVAWFIGDPLVLFPRYRTLADLPFPLSRSFWLLLIYWPLAIFILTSTDSWLAQGLVMALGLGLGIELLSNFHQPAAITTAFHFPTQSKWQVKELQAVQIGWLVALVVVVLLFII